MRLFVVLSFVVLALAYWQLSGGAGFRPEAWPAAAPPRAEAPVETRPETPPEAPAEALSAAPPEVPPEMPPEASSAATRPDPGPSEPLAPEDALAAISPPEPGLPEPAAPGPAPSEFSPSEPAAPVLRTVTGDRVNLRAGPGTEHAVVGRLGAGELAEVLERQAGWARLRAVGGLEGWMAERFLAPAPP